MKPSFSLVFSIFFLLFLAQHQAFGQITTYVNTNTTTWQCRWADGINVDPLPYSVLNSGVWTTPLQSATWPQSCQNPAITNYPGGQPITTPTHMDCDQQGNYTSYFRTSFALPNANPTCVDTISIRADNFFRLYVNGTLVPSSAQIPASLGTDGTCFGEVAAHNVTGNGYLHIKKFDISPYINPNLAQQTILIEVGNCDYLNYVSARIGIHQSIVPGPDPTINFTLTSSNQLTLWGNANGWTSHTWTLETSSSENGPWSFLTSNTSQRVSSTWTTAVPPCVFVRITHTVSYFCGTTLITATAQHVIFTCGGFKSGEGVGSLTEGGTDERSAVSGNDPETPSAMETAEIFPNPTADILNVRLMNDGVDQLIIWDYTGKALSRQQISERETAIDCSTFPNGMYLLSGTNAQGEVLLRQKFLIYHGN